MTAGAELLFKRSNKRLRYSHRAIGLQHSGPVVFSYRGGRHARVPRGTVTVLRSAARTLLSKDLQQAVLHLRPRRSIRIAELNPAARAILRNAGRARRDWRLLGPAGLLPRINDPSATERDREMAVLIAETTAFDEALRRPLLTELAAFITNDRFTRDDRRITTVGSAVRKYAMNMDEADFDLYASWIRPTATQTITSRIELELVKGACWRLSYLPVASGIRCRALAAGLTEVANAYLAPRLILQKNYASIALHAIVAVIILQALSGEGDAVGAILQRVVALQSDWFSELLDDDLYETYDTINEHDPRLAQRIRELVDANGN